MEFAPIDESREVHATMKLVATLQSERVEMRLDRYHWNLAGRTLGRLALWSVSCVPLSMPQRAVPFSSSDGLLVKRGQSVAYF
jgi:hypothetical protein